MKDAAKVTGENSTNELSGSKNPDGENLIAIVKRVEENIEKESFPEADVNCATNEKATKDVREGLCKNYPQDQNANESNSNKLSSSGSSTD